MKSFFKNNQGFIRIEIMAVFVITGVIGSIAVSKINDISGTAEQRALETGIVELNAREMLFWTNAKFSPDGWSGSGGDAGVGGVWDNMDTFIGPEYSWTAPPTDGGGELNFKSQSINLTRTSSTNTTAARWAPT